MEQELTPADIKENDSKYKQEQCTDRNEQEPDLNRDKTLFYLDKVQRKETRDFIKKIDVDNNGKVTESEVVQYIKNETVMTKKATFYKKTAFWLLLMVVALIASVAVLIVYVSEGKSNTLSKDEAVTLLGNVVNDVVSTNMNSSNFSLAPEEISDIRRVFDSFDTDSDGLLNVDEFSEYWLHLKPNKNAFGRMDIDGDKILSYREIVAYLTAAHKIPSTRPIFTNLLGNAVKWMYNYTYNATNTDPIFFEYAADIYFGFLDPGYKGYISHIDYVKMVSGSTFYGDDIDGDGKLSFDEFINGTIYEEGISLISNTMLTAVSFNDLEFTVSLNESDVIGVELHKCPNHNIIQSAAAKSTRRRLLPHLAAFTTIKGMATYCFKNPYICSLAWDAITCAVTALDTIWDCNCAECESCPVPNEECRDCLLGMHCPSEYCDCECDWCHESIAVNKADCPQGKASTLSDCVEPMKNCINYMIKNNEKDCCFAEDGIVRLKDGSIKQLRNVSVGEFIFDGDGYTKVIAVERRGDLKLKMVTLYMSFSDDGFQEKSITLTGDHLLYDKNNKLIPASSLKIGDILYDNYAIYNIEQTEQWPATPITMSGQIYVNDIKASCYIGNARTAAIFHDLLAVYRWTSENVNEWAPAKLIESSIYEVMWLKDQIVEPYNLYWIFEASSISVFCIAVFGMVGIYLSKVFFWVFSCLSCQKIVICCVCGLISFRYQNKR